MPTSSNKNNFLSMANRTSASFYSSTSFNKNSTHYTSLSTQMNFSVKCRKKTKTINKINNFHHRFLRDKLLKNEAYQLLEKTVRTNVFLTHNDNLTLDKNDFIPNSSTKRSVINCKNITVPSSFIPICTEEYHLYNSGTPRAESVTQFMNKTNYLRRNNIIHQLQQEKHKKFIEGCNVQMQQLEMMMYSYNLSQTLLNAFTKNFTSYIKFLNLEIEKNKKILKELVFKLSNLMKDIKSINHKISILRSSINLGKTYKTFLLCVKFRVLTIDNLPREVYQLYQLDDIKPKPPSRIQRRPTRKLSKLITKRSIKLGPPPTEAPTTNNPLHSFQKHIISNPPIFSSVEEFNQSLQDLETNTIKYLNKYNDLQSELKFENEYLDKKKKLKQDNQNDEKEEEERAEYILHELKRKNVVLKQELSELESNAKHKFFNKIFKKIISILENFPFNLEKEFDCPNIYSVLDAKAPTILVRGIKQNTILYGLSVIEAVLLDQINKYHNLSSDMRTSMEISKIKIALDTHKRIMNSRLKIKEEKERREKINENILQKFNKLLYLPNRKMSLTLYNAGENHQSRNKNKHKHTRNTKTNVYEMLTY